MKSRPDGLFNEVTPRANNLIKLKRFASGNSFLEPKEFPLFDEAE
jgi:hypothetical protein